MHDLRVVQALFESLRIETTRSTSKARDKQINQRSEKKIRFANPADLGYCRERVAQYIEKSAALGIPVPATLALDPL